MGTKYPLSEREQKIERFYLMMLAQVLRAHDRQVRQIRDLNVEIANLKSQNIRKAQRR